MSSPWLHLASCAQFCLMTFSGRILSITDGFGTWILGIISLLQHQICIYSPVLHYVKGWTPDCSVVDFNPSRYSDHLAFDSVRNFASLAGLNPRVCSVVISHLSPSKSLANTNDFKCRVSLVSLAGEPESSCVLFCLMTFSGRLVNIIPMNHHGLVWDLDLGNQVTGK